MAKNAVLVYSDVLLDDLCALEYLSTKYKELILVAVNVSDLADSDYASDRVKNIANITAVVNKWFDKATVIDASSKYVISAVLIHSDVEEVFSLAPMSAIVEDMKKCPMLRSKKITLMAGSKEGAEGFKNEWNAMADPDAYKEFFELASNYEQFTYEDCKILFVRRGIPFESEFQTEYYTKMVNLNEDICNFDLQAVYGRETE